MIYDFVVCSCVWEIVIEWMGCINCCCNILGSGCIWFIYCNREYDRSVFKGLLFNKYEIIFNYKFNVNECN